MTILDLLEQIDVRDETWQDRGLCAQTDPDAFFPEKGESNREAKRVCQRCEVKAECLDYALTHDLKFGIWGGLSTQERGKIRKLHPKPTADTPQAA